MPPVFPTVASSFCVCFLEDLCLGPFLLSCQVLRHFFILFSLCQTCFTCVSGLESNFYRHHLDLMKVSTFCTTIVWPVYQSRSEAWIPYFPSSCEGNRINFANGDQYVGFPRPGTNDGEWCAMEGTWRSEERSIKSVSEAVWTRRYYQPHPTGTKAKAGGILQAASHLHL